MSSPGRKGGHVGPSTSFSLSSADGVWRLEEIAFYRRAAGWPSGFSAVGGTVTESGGYTIHTFTSSGSFVLTSTGALSVEYLIVGGGGGGGSSTNDSAIKKHLVAAALAVCCLALRQ